MKAVRGQSDANCRRGAILTASRWANVHRLIRSRRLYGQLLIPAIRAGLTEGKLGHAGRRGREAKHEEPHRLSRIAASHGELHQESTGSSDCGIAGRESTDVGRYR